MRLLAYGGTSFVVRCRIGEWPPIPDGALSDIYCLSMEKLAYGVGLLTGHLPYLIIRQRQNVQNRGGYAYTLLLDPGEGVWAQFAWNAAQLMLALFGEGHALGARLLESPEGLTHEEIESALAGLRPAAPVNCRHPIDDLRSLLVGATLYQSPAVISPKDVGFDACPSMECMAAVLEQLPLPFRVGYGWIAGGSEEQGQAFGARLIFDEGALAGSEAADQRIHQGRQSLADWLTVSQHAPDAIQDVSQEPLWNWGRKWKTPAAFFADLRVFAKDIRSKTQEDVDGSQRETGDPAVDEGPFAEQSRRLAVKLMRKNDTQLLSETETRRILWEYLNNKLELTPQEVRRLHPPTVVEYFVALRRFPDMSSSGISLGWPSRYEIWMRLAAESATSTDVVANLKAAVADLTGDDPERPEGFDVKVRALAEQAVALTAREGLLTWLGTRADEVLAPWVKAPLARAAERHAAALEGDWPLEYVAFAGDQGGEVLANQYLDTADTKKLVDVLLGQMKAGGPLADESRRWLEALACSRLRADLRPQSKFDIAKEGVEGWQWLDEMWRLFHDQLEAADRAATVTEEERKRLRAELRDLAKPDRLISAVPNLRGLAKLLGALLEEDVAALAALNVSLPLAKAPQWLEGFRELGYEDIYQVKLADLTLKTKAGNYEQLPLDQLDAATLRGLIEKLLFGHSGGWDPEWRDRLVRLVTLPATRERAAAALKDVFASFPEDRAKALNWARRFGDGDDSVNVLFDALDLELQISWVSRSARYGGDLFARKVSELLYTSPENGTPLTPYGRAVLHFLRTDEGAAIKEQVATDQHSFVRAGNIDKDIAERLGEDAEAAAPVDKSRVEKSPARRRKWADILQPYLPPILHSSLFKTGGDADAGGAERLDEKGEAADTEDKVSDGRPASESSPNPAVAVGTNVGPLGPSSSPQQQTHESTAPAKSDPGDVHANGAAQGR